MPWLTPQFQQDTERLGVGTATVVFADDTGRTVVSHSGRIDNSDGATIGGFIDEALAKYQKAQAQDTETAAVLAKIQDVLNQKTKA